MRALMTTMRAYQNSRYTNIEEKWSVRATTYRGHFTYTIIIPRLHVDHGHNDRHHSSNRPRRPSVTCHTNTSPPARPPGLPDAAGADARRAAAGRCRHARARPRTSIGMLYLHLQRLTFTIRDSRRYHLYYIEPFARHARRQQQPASAASPTPTPRFHATRSRSATHT